MKYVLLSAVFVALSSSASVLAAGLSCTFSKNYEIIETRTSQSLDLEYWFPGSDGNVGVSIGGNKGNYGINIHESCGIQCDKLLGGAWEVTDTVRVDGKLGADVFSAKCSAL